MRGITTQASQADFAIGSKLWPRYDFRLCWKFAAHFFRKNMLNKVLCPE